jgi:TolB-like protein
VKASTKEKKKDKVLINLELVDMKNASLLNSEELGRKTIEAKKEKLVEEKKEYQRN